MKGFWSKNPKKDSGKQKSAKAPNLPAPNFQIAGKAPSAQNQSKGPIDLKAARNTIARAMAPFKKG